MLQAIGFLFIILGVCIGYWGLYSTRVFASPITFGIMPVCFLVGGSLMVYAGLMLQGTDLAGA